jgi:hypothetical protein
LTVNDIFLNLTKFTYRGEHYARDRAWAFEKQLNDNTGNVLDKPLMAYARYEKNAVIPIILVSPSVVNDGRQMYISNVPVSYLSYINVMPGSEKTHLRESFEYSRLFKNHGAEKIRFTSVLRMNATFPYVMPSVSLPTEPQIEVMDAGLRDNFGIRTSTKYMLTFKDWIEENTRGVLFIQIRDSRQETDREYRTNRSLLRKLVSPIGNVYDNLLTIQEYDQMNYIKTVAPLMNVPFHFLSFELPTREERISLSWHLTKREKILIKNALEFTWNQRAFTQLTELLNPESKNNR